MEHYLEKYISVQNLNSWTTIHTSTVNNDIDMRVKGLYKRYTNQTTLSRSPLISLEISHQQLLITVNYVIAPAAMPLLSNLPDLETSPKADSPVCPPLMNLMQLCYDETSWEGGNARCLS